MHVTVIVLYSLDLKFGGAKIQTENVEIGLIALRVRLTGFKKYIMTNSEKAIEYALKHIEDFGEAKYTRTGELQCVGRLHYNCVNLAAVFDIIKIMEGKEI